MRERGGVSSQGSMREGPISKRIWLLAGFSFLEVVGMSASESRWPLAGGHLWFLAMWASSTWPLASSKAARSERESANKTDHLM